MKIIAEPVNLETLWKNRETPYEEMMKIVVDVKKDILAIDGELHADLEKIIMEQGSAQEDLWGANIYPMKGKGQPAFIEYAALINIRPSAGNRGIKISDDGIREKVKRIVERLLI